MCNKHIDSVSCANKRLNIGKYEPNINISMKLEKQFSPNVVKTTSKRHEQIPVSISLFSNILRIVFSPERFVYLQLNSALHFLKPD